MGYSPPNTGFVYRYALQDNDSTNGHALSDSRTAVGSKTGSPCGNCAPGRAWAPHRLRLPEVTVTNLVRRLSACVSIVAVSVLRARSRCLRCGHRSVPNQPGAVREPKRQLRRTPCPLCGGSRRTTWHGDDHRRQRRAVGLHAFDGSALDEPLDRSLWHRSAFWRQPRNPGRGNPADWSRASCGRHIACRRTCHPGFRNLLRPIGNPQTRDTCCTNDPSPHNRVTTGEGFPFSSCVPTASR